MSSKNLLILIIIFWQGLRCAALAQNEDKQLVVGRDAYYIPVFTFSNDTIVKIDTLKNDIVYYFNRAQNSISNQQGKLQFYTNGVTVFNKQMEIMQNGDTIITSQRGINLYNNKSGWGYFMQNIIFANELDTNKYYIVYTDVVEGCDIQNRQMCRMYYAEIDMQANNGLGKVKSYANLLYEGIMSNSKLTACRHANGRDWWVVKNAYNSNRWIKFLVTPQGIEGPFFQNIGSPAGELDDGSYAAFSNNGSLFVNSLLGSVEVMDFDRCTGMMSNVRTLNIPYNRGLYGVMGIAFSPSDKYMYIISLIESFQYNMSSNDWQGSVIRIADLWNTPYDAEKCFLAPDGKIYIGNSCYGLGLTIINNPEAEGTACNITYDNKFGVLSEDYYCGGAIPNMPNYRLGALNGSPCDTLTTIKEYGVKERGYKVYPNPTNGNASISYMLENNMPAQLIITDIVGKQIKNVELIATKQIETIDCKNLANGIYTVKIMQSNKLLYSQKLSINK